MAKVEAQAVVAEAISAGNLELAQQVLKEAAETIGVDPGLWLQYAAVSRRAGELRDALQAVVKALEIDPLEFTALLMHASLLERLGEDAGAAWDYALAQRPDGPLPPPLAAAVSEGELKRAAWIKRRSDRLREAMAQSESQADQEALSRINRFRSNALRETEVYHSNPTHFHFPGLAEHEWHARSAFPWLENLEGQTNTILAELKAVLASERAELEPYIQYAAHEPLAQWRSLNHNPAWTALHLLRNGQCVNANARHCPQTLAFLAGLDQPRIAGAGPNAMFSLLAPNTSIPPHSGYTNTRLVCHLPLVVPKGCWFRVGSERREWKRGEAFLFDDTIEHEAANPSDEVRIVLIFDVWHPGLIDVERRAVAELIATEGAPNDA